MTIKRKVKIIASLFLGSFFIIMVFYIDFNVIKSYYTLEHNEALKSVSKIGNFIDTKIEDLDNVNRDWAEWDDAYNYINGNDPTFVDANFVENTFINLKINMIFVLDKNGKLLTGKAYDYKESKELELPSEIVEIATGVVDKAGIISLKNGTQLVASIRSVYNSGRTKPSNGTIAMAYYVDSDVLEKISKNLEMNVKLEVVTTPVQETYKIIPKDDKIFCSVFRNDLKRNVTLSFSTILERDILHIGKETITDFIVFFAIIFLVYSVSLIFMLRRVILLRLDRLCSDVNNITIETHRSIDKRIKLAGNDELSTLKDSINAMLDHIDNINSRIAESEEKYRALYEESAAIHLVLDNKATIRDANRVLLGLLSYEKEQMIRRRISQFILPEDIEKLERYVQNCLSGKIQDGLEVRFIGTSGKVSVLILSSVSPLMREKGRSDTILLTGTDITVRKEMEKKLAEHASKDAMTGLYNRRIGIETLQNSISLAERQKYDLTVCYIDVNGLKRVNDKHGHLAGDQLIKDVADLLKKNVRDSDVLCRMGGDEFLVVLPGCNSEMAETFWQRVLQDTRQLNQKPDRMYQIQVSHGFAQYEKETTVETLLEKADSQMYREKNERSS